MSDILQWRERPWTIWIVAGIGLVTNLLSLLTDTGVGNLILTSIALGLLAGLWHGNPGVRLYYIFALLVLVVMNLVAFLNEPGANWSGLAVSVAMFALLLAPPTHRWAQQREQERDLKRRSSRL